MDDMHPALNGEIAGAEPVEPIGFAERCRRSDQPATVVVVGRKVRARGVSDAKSGVRKAHRSEDISECLPK